MTLKHKEMFLRHVQLECSRDAAFECRLEISAGKFALGLAEWARK